MAARIKVAPAIQRAQHKVHRTPSVSISAALVPRGHRRGVDAFLRVNGIPVFERSSTFGRRHHWHKDGLQVHTRDGHRAVGVTFGGAAKLQSLLQQPVAEITHGGRKAHALLNPGQREQRVRVVQRKGVSATHIGVRELLMCQKQRLHPSMSGAALHGALDNVRRGLEHVLGQSGVPAEGLQSPDFKRAQVGRAQWTARIAGRNPSSRS